MAACERDFLVWFGFAGITSKSSSSEDSEGGRSPGAAACCFFFAMAASFLAFAAARRCSRVRDWVWEDSASSSEFDFSSEDDSSSSSDEASFSFESCEKEDYLELLRAHEHSVELR